MAEKYATNQLMVPEVDMQDAVPIETTIGNLRKDIETKCTALLQRARTINAATHGSGPFRLRFWENRIGQVRNAQMTTFSIQELRHLKRQCQTISHEMEEFSKGLL